ncbi:MAG: Ig-like domain-containing protein [Meiothermus sp.]|uniref:Ig-like domain-containing protein n=1 Tax=Meiothermus sp. TaxID=1955249 RepID=UPI0025CFC239|nr:Ig-like domain-containing protein [Meiothermus sp.]MCS7069688.1 Ig-like domain-containing protein [Meiothermus sp.]
MRRYIIALLATVMVACGSDPSTSTGSPGSPSLKILSPVSGASLSSPSVTVQVTASDDTAVSRLTYRVNGAGEVAVTITPGPTVSASFAVSSLRAGSNTIVVTAYDTSGQSSSASLNIQVSSSNPSTYPIPSGPTFYVGPGGSNTNDGSRERPWATITYAAAQLKPGQILRVLPGTYNEAVSVSVSGTASQRIVIASDTRWGAKINAQGALFGIDVRGSYIDVIGFEVTNSTNSGIISWRPYNRFLFNHVYGIRAQCDSNGGAGVNMSSPDSSDGAMIGNLVHDIGDLSAGFCTRIHGIYQGAPRGTVQNNITYRARGFGITTWHAATAVTISNNLSFANLYGGISVGSGDNTRGNVAENFLVANNIVVGNPRGISEENNTGVNRFVNNLVWNNTTNWRLQTSSHQGSLSLDPGFVNYRPDGSGDYTLSSSSPAIDKGIPERAPEFDFLARPRVQGATLDLGPFEVR